MSPVLEVHGAAVQRGPLELLSDIELTADRGECLAIVGESGAGKSLTCRLLNGTLPRIGAEVSRGEACFDGVDLVTLDAGGWRRLRRERIGFVPQASLSSLNPVRTVGQQLAETVRELRGHEPTEAELIAQLQQVQLTRPARVLGCYPHELSGGMRQRVMIALAIAGDPDLLIADEPTTALDVTVQREILDLLRALREERELTVVLVTHDLGLVEAESDRVAILYAGMTVESGPTASVIADPAHPYTRALLGALPGRHARRERLTAIGGRPPEPRAWPAGCRFAPRCPHALERCTLGDPPLEPQDDERANRCIRSEELGARLVTVAGGAGPRA